MLRHLHREPGFYKRLFRLALPLILWRAHTGLKLPTWFFYGFSPVHLGAIALVRWCLGV